MLYTAAGYFSLTENISVKNETFLETNVFKLGTTDWEAWMRIGWTKKCSVKIFRQEDDYEKYKASTFYRFSLHSSLTSGDTCLSSQRKGRSAGFGDS